MLAGRQLDMENAAELSRYDEIQAQAWAIAARYRLNGMGSIESGQSIAVDVEMGGTGGDLRDQDQARQKYAISGIDTY